MLDGAGIPLLLISHDPNDIEIFGGQIACIENGRLTSPPGSRQRPTRQPAFYHP